MRKWGIQDKLEERTGIKYRDEVNDMKFFKTMPSVKGCRGLINSRSSLLQTTDSEKSLDLSLIDSIK